MSKVYTSLKKFLLEDNCFTILCWLLPHIIMNQPQVHIYLLPLEPPSISHSTPPLELVTEYSVELPVSQSKFPLAVCFTYGNVYVSMLLSQFVPPLSFPKGLFISVTKLSSRSDIIPINIFSGSVGIHFPTSFMPLANWVVEKTVSLHCFDYK